MENKTPEIKSESTKDKNNKAQKVKIQKSVNIILSSILITIGCLLVINMLMFNADNNSTPKFTEEEELAFVKAYSDKVLEQTDSAVLIKELDLNISMLSENEAVDAVDGLLYVMFNQFYGIQHTEEFKVKAWDYIKAGIDINDVNALNQIKDKDFVSYVVPLIEKGYCFEVTDAGLEFFVDYEALITKYSKYLTEAFVDTLKFYKDESFVKFINLETGELNYDVIASRAVETEMLIAKHEKGNSRYLEAFKQSNDFYNQLYFGALEFDYIYDASGKLLDSSKTHMEKMITEKTGTKFVQNIQAYLAKMEQNDFIKTTDIEVFLIDLTNVPQETQEQIVKETTEVEGTTGVYTEEVIDTISGVQSTEATSGN